jgi:hypothetical protein
MRRVSNIPLRTHDWRVLQRPCHYHLSLFVPPSKLSISFLWCLSIYWCWSSRIIMLMIILTSSVKSILVFKSKRAAIVIWSPFCAARKIALSRSESSIDWTYWIKNASNRGWRNVRRIVYRMWFSALFRLHERSHITRNSHGHNIIKLQRVTSTIRCHRYATKFLVEVWKVYNLSPFQHWPTSWTRGPSYC